MATSNCVSHSPLTHYLSRSTLRGASSHVSLKTLCTPDVNRSPRVSDMCFNVFRFFKGFISGRLTMQITKVTCGGSKTTPWLYDGRSRMCRGDRLLKWRGFLEWNFGPRQTLTRHRTSYNYCDPERLITSPCSGGKPPSC